MCHLLTRSFTSNVWNVLKVVLEEKSQVTHMYVLISVHSGTFVFSVPGLKKTTSTSMQWGNEVDEHIRVSLSWIPPTIWINSYLKSYWLPTVPVHCTCKHSCGSEESCEVGPSSWGPVLRTCGPCLSHITRVSLRGSWDWSYASHNCSVYLIKQKNPETITACFNCLFSAGTNLPLASQRVLATLNIHLYHVINEYAADTDI